MRKEAFAAAALAAIWVMTLMPAAAQQWPDKPVRIMVPFPPGGGTDIQARLLSVAFQKSTGQSFIIDNRTGASGLIASQLVVDSAPDGNTILFTSGSISVVATLRAKQMKFDVYNDLLPVSWISSTPLVLVSHPSVPVKSVKELTALAKRSPTRMNVGGNTVGSTSHLSAEMFNQTVGIKSTVVTYRGGGPAVIALISGELDYAFVTAPSIMPHLRSGRARGLAVTTPKRSSAMPDLPTLNSVYPGFETGNWYAMFYPKGTPKPIVDKLNAEIRKALNTPEVKAFYPREALDAVGSSPAELATLLKQEIAKYAKVIKAANIRVE
ncbi:MAG: tripartite tricarboxylate transporter substrate binding protein [Betaproteobacteria bacterium]|nr:tripartite tricarboxylate transporter substrate binding protein [Betaproteobacteria bacterium]